MLLAGSRAPAQWSWCRGIVLVAHELSLVALRREEFSWIRGQLHAPCIGRQILTHNCTTREVQRLVILRQFFQNKNLYFCKRKCYDCCSVACLGVSDSLLLHGLQHARLPCLSTVSWSLLKLMFIESVMPSKHLILCHPLLFLPSIFLSIRVFSSELALYH